MRLFLLFVYLILILLGVSFAALNSSLVKINFYVTSIELPISIMMTIMLGIGILIGLLFFSYRYLRLKHQCKKLNDQLKITEKEIKNLRSIPIQDQH